MYNSPWDGTVEKREIYNVRIEVMLSVCYEFYM